jgi:5-methylcytosine-specific restriction enzyme A
MKYAVITENDESQWKDETGVRYHFPSRYAKYLMPGTSVVYYKGTMKDRRFANKRLSPFPHYFGKASIGNISKDVNIEKGDLFAEIISLWDFTKVFHSRWTKILSKWFQKGERQITGERESDL